MKMKMKKMMKKMMKKKKPTYLLPYLIRTVSRERNGRLSSVNEARMQL